MLISDDYRDQNALRHKQVAAYGGTVKGATRAVPCKQIMRDTGSITVLDYGCGKGGLVIQLRNEGAQIHGYDPAVEEFSGEPQPADLIVCFEGPEHFEPECVEACLAHIRKLTCIAAWLVTALNPSKEILPDGRNAHACIQPAEWWIDQFSKHFPIVKTRACTDKALEVLCFIH